MNIQNTQTLEYIKQLEKDNQLLRNRIMHNMLSENMQITRMKFEIQNLEQEIERLKRRNAHILLFGN